MPDATVFMGVPTLYVRMLAEPALNRDAVRNMRLFIAGSAPLLIETFAEWQQRTGHTILERYGMSETAMLTSNPYAADALQGPERAARRHGGLPAARRVAARAGRRGQGAAHRRDRRHPGQGPNVFQGYWRMPRRRKRSSPPTATSRPATWARWTSAAT
jgi:malonyl-CoA/methylmalonyl-CoA synthetase